jgi:serine protease
MPSTRLVPTLLLLMLLGGCTLFINPRLELSTNAIDLGQNAWGPVEIRNSGGKTLSWQISETSAWLTAVTADGSSEGSLGAGQSTTLYIVANVAGFELSPGSYRGSVGIDSNTSLAEIDVDLTIPEDGSTDRCGGAIPAPPPPLRDTTTQRTATRPSVVPGQLLVRFTHGAALTPQAADVLAAAIADTYGFRLLRGGRGVRSDLLALPPGENPESAAARLADDPRVLYAEPNRYLYAQEIPNDPDLGDQWYLCRFGMPAAWDITSGNDSGALTGRTVVAIIDSGVDTDHEDLAARMLPGHDFCTSSDCSTAPDDDPNSNDSHGTHVAGIAAAAGDNGIGVAGVAYTGVTILPVKVFDDFGISATVDSLANGILWAVGQDVQGQIFGNANVARILNLSLGGNVDSQTLRDAVTAARNAGALVIAASGNTGGGDRTPHDGILAPADSPGALAVGAVNSNGQRASFSMFDALGGPTVSLLAPGGRLIDAAGGTSPFDRGILNTFPNDSYSYQVGTSMATPFVSGVAALIWSAEPGLSDDDVIDRLLTSTRFEAGWDPLEYGAGVLCADLALGLTTVCGDAP